MPKNNYLLTLLKKEIVGVFLFATLLGGCAGAAAPLPSDRATSTNEEIENQLGISSTDRSMTCVQIAEERKNITHTTTALEKRIDGNRGRNQAAGYFGIFFLVPLVAIENDTEAKEELSRLQMRRDQLNYLKAEANCT